VSVLSPDESSGLLQDKKGPKKFKQPTSIKTKQGVMSTHDFKA
jgi:hypothetical protein